MSADPRTDPPTPDPLTHENRPVTDAGRRAVRAIKSGTLALWADDPADPIAAMIAEVERSAAPPSAPDQRLRDAAYETVAWSVVEVGPGSYQCRECHADVTDVNAPHDPDCVHDALRAALSEATTSPEATLDVWDRDLTVPEKERLAHALAVSDYRNWQPYEVADKIAGTVRTIAAARLRGPA